MGQFHDRMEADMEVRGFSPQTRKAYLRCMRAFVGHFMRPPDQLTPDHIHQYQLHLTRGREVSTGTFNQAIAALRFFYRVTLKKDWAIQEIPYRKKARKLPEILSPEKVTALFSSAKNLKHRAILMTLYAGGLRVNEAVHLKLSDIDSQRMVIRVEQAKGRKDRYVMLSPKLLEVLRQYWKAFRPRTWLFPGQPSDKPIDRATVNRMLHKVQKAAGIRGRVYPHLLRHSFATHLMEHGTHLPVIQRLLGHRSLRSTEIYTHVAKNYLHETPSPLDTLPDPMKAPPGTD
ncbi:MAG: tyrosine-type recombinase/integrase [Thermoanaerobaculia bacterium]